MAVVNGGTQVLSWGWPLCTRTSYRFLETYERLPRLVRFMSQWTPMYSSGKDIPTPEAEFPHPLVDIKMGCGFVTALDARNNVFAWGDNYAG